MKFKIVDNIITLLIITFLSGFMAQTNVLEDQGLDGDLLQTGNEPYIRVFNFVNALPEGIVSERTVAFIQVKEENPQRNRWKALAEEVHETMVRSGTDVVGYFNLLDVYAGLETQQYFSDNLTSRNVMNILLIEQEGNNIRLIATPFNAKSTFTDQGQNAWKTEGPDLDEILNTYRRAVGNSGQSRTNFLITDKPEFFEDAAIIRKRRYEVFNPDLKLDKLAVPTFPWIESAGVNAGADPGLISAYQQQWKNDSARLTEIMQAYPFEYEIITGDFVEEELRNQGFQFILYSLHTSGNIIRDMLNYNSDQKVTEYISFSASSGSTQLVTIPFHQPVYKYYIKHIYSEEIYLGEKWDADTRWEQALSNHIAGLKEKIK